ncbi:hypothetical protein B296_00009090 [Ensete ventricosum]|uniref:Uncharacterized protein n=1 Tax=Ensete ventricosum TaxID=4639 RepID=A0A426ZTE7_ENSVE|nr:hypothetical protein B296_00009090 [Ensete ventricosum]
MRDCCSLAAAAPAESRRERAAVRARALAGSGSPPPRRREVTFSNSFGRSRYSFPKNNPQESIRLGLETHPVSSCIRTGSELESVHRDAVNLKRRSIECDRSEERSCN